jgi:K+-sensing histidine kinase KdpD
MYRLKSRRTSQALVLLVAATARLWVAVTTSFVAMLALNFFFLPPIGTFTIADAQNWIALFAFLAVSLVTNNLSSIAGARTKEALARRDELGPLFDLSRDVLLITDSQEANARRAVSISTTRRSASLTHPVGPSFKRGLANSASPKELHCSRASPGTLIAF